MSYSQFDMIYERLDELESAVEKLKKRLNAKKAPATEAPADEWPDDEDHLLGPNGERLIAVEKASCEKCFYPHLSDECIKAPCFSFRRSDKRSVHWELAGDRK